MSKLGWIQLIEKRCQLWILEERDRTSKEGTMHETFKTTEAHSAYNCIRGRVPGEVRLWGYGKPTQNPHLKV